VVSGITILVLTVVSVAVGWWLAGRVLSPLHQITATARRLSLSNLNERIALTGPRDELKEPADTFDAMLDRLETIC
jgi:nitrate/nitrite-specific signal transduction histidine kinase